ncbi:hypothetical protein [Pectinatus frisingensis]|uniref:hypothetical protein n=1 Tax=Pectinatus frisingensis TaxID=865 RepID=UPI003D80700B
MNKHSFILDKSMFEKFLIKHCKIAGINPKNIIQFGLILPFQLEFPLGGFVPIEFKEKQCVIDFHFSELDYPVPILLGAIPISGGECYEQAQTFTKYQTRVEMTFITEANIDVDKKQYMTQVFDFLLENLNILICAHRLITDTKDIYEVTCQMLSPIIISRIITIEDWNEETILFHLNYNLPVNKNKVNKETYMKIIQMYCVVKGKRNPFITSKLLNLDAHYFFDMGQYRNSVIYGQVSIESLIGSALKEMLTCEGMTKDEVETFIEECSFIKMVETQMHNKLGGCWDTKNDKKVVGKWYKNTYKLRNRIVHGAYLPNHEETGIG